MSKSSFFISLLTGIVSGAIAGAIMFSIGVVILLTNPGYAADWILQHSNVEVSQDASLEISGTTPLVGELVANEASVIQVVEEVKPAVVSIMIKKDVPIIEQYYEQDPFFGFQMPQYRQNGTEKQEIGGGSGFIVSADGMIVTNKHVVADPDAEYSVFTNEGQQFEATVIARDTISDIAVLDIETTNDLPYLDFGNSDQLQVGQTAIAIGNALGEFSNSVSVGVVSGLSRSITAGDAYGGELEQLEDVVQTDAAINPGNSGGPLLNLKGKVIGVNVAVANAENIGFALPANTVQQIVDSVKKTGKIVRPALGVRYIDVTPEIAQANDLLYSYGALVLRGLKPEDLAVVPGSAADKAGIVENDIILEIDDIKLETITLASVIAKKKVGDIIKLKLLHAGEEKVIEVTLEEVSS